MPTLDDNPTQFFDPPTLHHGRRADCTIQAITFDRDVWAILRHYVPPMKRAVGTFISRLIIEHHARETERQRILDEQQAASNGNGHAED
jgi:hypothetical protein